MQYNFNNLYIIKYMYVTIVVAQIFYVLLMEKFISVKPFFFSWVYFFSNNRCTMWNTGQELSVKYGLPVRPVSYLEYIYMTGI